MLSRVLPLASIQSILEYRLGRQRFFDFNSQRLEYFFHSYNNFGLTERAIEAPIIRSYILGLQHRTILEIGNVTNHYYEYFREAFLGKSKKVIDKFEAGPDVLNIDVGDYTSPDPFDLIFSISTFEHMDSDLGRNPDYVPGTARLGTVAADNIFHVCKTLLADGGTFVITAPLGYTPEWDATFYSDALSECPVRLRNLYLLRRVGETEWEQVDVSEGRDAPSTSWESTRQFLSVVELEK